jgi:hypothetical protein
MDSFLRPVKLNQYSLYSTCANGFEIFNNSRVNVKYELLSGSQSAFGTAFVVTSGYRKTGTIL